MAPISLLAALLTLVGVGIALGATNGRLTVVGLGLALLPMPLIGADAPALLVLAFRTLAVLAALFLLDLGVRWTTPLVGPIRLGGGAETGAVVAAWLIGLLLSATDPAPRGPALALATALALAVAAFTLLAFGSDTLRLGAGATLALAAGATLVPALGGRDDAALELALSAAFLAVAGVTTRLATLGVTVRHDLALADLRRDIPHELPRETAREWPGEMPPEAPREEPREEPRGRRREPRLDLPRLPGLPGLPGIPRDLRLSRPVAIVLALVVLAGAAYVGAPTISDWARQLGAGGGPGASTTPVASATWTPAATPAVTGTPEASPTATPEPTPTATPGPSPTAKPRYYVVQPGETLGIIARRFGVTVAAIQKANGISDPRLLRAGQRIIIPNP